MAGLFCKSSWLHTTAYLKWIRHFARKLKKVLTEVWKYKNAKKNMNKIIEHEITDMLHWELRSVVPKTDGEIYVSMSIDKYIITATCFLHCAKEGRVVGNIKSEVFIWKIIVEKISMLKWYKKKDYRTLLFSTKQNLKFLNSFGSCSLQWRG